VDAFLEVGLTLGDIIFYGFAVADDYEREGKDVFGPLLKKETKAWWHQVNKESLLALQTSGWGICTECSTSLPLVSAFTERCKFSK
jgi:hypothetical protein